MRLNIYFELSIETLQQIMATSLLLDFQSFLRPLTQKLFKGEKFSREEIIRGYMVFMENEQTKFNRTRLSLNAPLCNARMP